MSDAAPDTHKKKSLVDNQTLVFSRWYVEVHCISTVMVDKTHGDCCTSIYITYSGAAVVIVLILL